MNKTFFDKILRCLGFCLAVILLLQLLSLVLVQRYDRMDCGKMNYHFSGIYGEPRDSIDVLLMGDSECYSGFSPMELWEAYGITSYGAGTLAQDPQETYEYLNDLLRHQHPQVLVLETDNLFSVFTKVTLDDRLRSEMRMAFPGIDNHDSWRYLFAKQEKNAPRPVDDSKGYYHVYQAVTPSQKALDRFMAPDDSLASIEPLRLSALKRILNRCRREGIQPVFVSTPSTKNWNMARHNRVLALSREFGVPYLDMNLLCEDMGFDWTRHTQDGGDHLNHPGAVLVTQYLGQWLLKEFELPDHRQDSLYDSWNESLRIYRDRVENQISNKEPMYRFPAE